jgi:regulator of protease activity HflC (stomatin/prohibitin superfamily)
MHLIPLWLPALLSGDDAFPSVLITVFAVIAGLVALAQKVAKARQTSSASIQAVKENSMPITPVFNYGAIRQMDVRAQGAATHTHPIAVFAFIVSLICAIVWLILFSIKAESSHNDSLMLPGLLGFLCLMLLGITFLFCLKVADQWDRVIVLRLGKFHVVQKAGAFWLMPFVDTVAKWIDTRVQTTDLTAEETLTKDTVPVDVDAVMFWLVYDPKKAALEVENFGNAVTWAAQTALRDLIGKTMLADLLVGRDVLDKQLQEIIDTRTEPWGVSVQSVEIREIKIPSELQDTMSRQAQAERERQARVILGESEKQIAQSFAEAAEMYKDNPTALHLRAMNMLFEGLKEKGSLMIIPSSAVDSMNLGVMGGLAALGGNIPGGTKIV